MNPQEILNKTREYISDHAGSDRDKWFYANRFVFARLQLDERKTKTQVKQKLFESNQPCYSCKKHFENKSGVHLHRLDEQLNRGLKAGKIVLGRCCISDDSPRWHCNKCEHEWGSIEGEYD